MLSFQVEGMSCGHCVKAVTEAVQEVAPGAKVDVDLTTGKVQIDGANDAAAVSHAITEAGYTVTDRQI
jgi:copper chaperone